MNQASAKLTRESFTTDRTLEFFSEKELQMQIGHSRNWWPIAMVKELIDNSLDSCETAGILPEIEVTVEPDAVSVKDNGPGLPSKVLEQSLDYMIRVSDKSHYVAPTRGQLGNALKCLWAVPFVMNGDIGQIDVVTAGRRHRIEVGVDRIAQKPKLYHTIENDGFVKNGTFVKIHLPEIASLLEHEQSSEFYNTPICITGLIGNYAAFNPHATFIYTDPEPDFNSRDDRSVTNFFKWLPINPTSPHWYSIERFRGLIAAYVSLEQNGGKVQTVRGFVSEFRDLKSTQKQKRVTDAAGLSRAYLHDLVEGDDISVDIVKRLLSAMIEHSKPVKPKALGLIGEDHIRAWMSNSYVAPDSIKYKKVCGETDGMPFVVEVASGAFEKEYQGCPREVTAGLNWSPALKIPFTELSELLGEARVNSYDPFRIFVHLACPRLDFSDRGKGQLSLTPEIELALEKAIKAVTKHITSAKKKADREDRLYERQLEDMRKSQKRKKMSVRDAAFLVMEKAYMKASDDNNLPANARQIMYAARPEVIELTGKPKPWKNSSYFTQTLLPDFLKEYPELTADWDVVYDARGKLTEPHTDKRVDLGTVAVREYVDGWKCDIPTNRSISFLLGIDTSGPVSRYRYVFFVEKEGFNELLESVELASRFDIAIMSTKGMSVTAARQLVAELSKKDVTILVLRDFDKAGFSIVNTLQSDTRRWEYETAPNVIDLGLRLSDVEQMSLASEDVTYNSEIDPRINLRESGATDDEADFLVSGGRPKAWHGTRVELNAMTSPQLVKWLESKLDQIGVTKVVPDEDTLTQAYKRAHYIAYINKAIRKASKNYDETVSVPDDLSDRVREHIEGSSLSWDDAIGDMAEE